MHKLTELAQKEIEGVKLKGNLWKIALANFGRKTTMPVSDVLKGEQGKHYIIAETAFRSLSKKHIEYEDDEVWSYTPIIIVPKVKKNSGSMKFCVFDNIWRYLPDFTKGFKKYELITTMKFKSAYAMRFYELISGQTKSLFVPLERPDGLHEQFYLRGKYEKVNDFHRKVIDVTRKELDKSSPYSFVAKKERVGKKIIGRVFFLVFYENRGDPALQEQVRMAKVTARPQLENNIYDCPKFSFDFKSSEINKNKKTLVKEQNRIPNFMGFLGELEKDARLAEDPKGYVIGAIKRKLKEI